MKEASCSSVNVWFRTATFFVWVLDFKYSINLKVIILHHAGKWSDFRNLVWIVMLHVIKFTQLLYVLNHAKYNLKNLQSRMLEICISFSSQRTCMLTNWMKLFLIKLIFLFSFMWIFHRIILQFSYIGIYSNFSYNCNQQSYIQWLTIAIIFELIYYRVSHSKKGKVILLWGGYIFRFLLIFLTLTSVALKNVVHFKNDHFRTISNIFFADYTYIFH